MTPLRLAAGTFDRGAYLSRDGGTTWEQAADGITHPRVLSMAFSPSHVEGGRSVLYAGTEPSALFRSIDDGRSWHELTTLQDIESRPTWSFPPRPWTHHVRAIALHHSDPALLLVGIELGGMMRSADGGETWEDHHPDACIDPHVIQTHPLQHDRVYEVAGDGVAWSRDAGASWTRDTEGMDRTYSWGLTVDPADPDLWYVSAAPGPGHAHSGDGGAEAHLYRKRGEDPWEVLPLDGDPGPLDRMPYALAAPAPGTVVVAMDDGTLWIGEDDGERWMRSVVRTSGVSAIAASHDP